MRISRAVAALPAMKIQNAGGIDEGSLGVDVIATASASANRDCKMELVLPQASDSLS